MEVIIQIPHNLTNLFISNVINHCDVINAIVTPIGYKYIHFGTPLYNIIDTRPNEKNPKSPIIIS